jgi:folate-dependent phosphoribosylglycinamide formyltransferase PurN
LGNKVLIDVISAKPNDETLKAALENAGMTGIINNGPDRFVITGYVDVNSITTLKNIPNIIYIRPRIHPFLMGPGNHER